MDLIALLVFPSKPVGGFFGLIKKKKKWHVIK